MPRRARRDAPGTLHHGILRGLERGQSVTEAEGRAAFLTHLGAVAVTTGTILYAWALLPNHAHLGTGAFVERLLAEGMPDSRASAFGRAGSARQRRSYARSVSGQGSVRRSSRWGGAAAGSPPCACGSRCAW
jgi:hypothetical protein